MYSVAETTLPVSSGIIFSEAIFAMSLFKGSSFVNLSCAFNLQSSSIKRLFCHTGFTLPDLIITYGAIL